MTLLLTILLSLNFASFLLPTLPKHGHPHTWCLTQNTDAQKLHRILDKFTKRLLECQHPSTNFSKPHQAMASMIPASPKRNLTLIMQLPKSLKSESKSNAFPNLKKKRPTTLTEKKTIQNDIMLICDNDICMSVKQT